MAATAKLDAMSPLKVLTRGYAMAQNEKQDIIRSVNQVSANDKLRISVIDGVIDTMVIGVEEGTK